MTSEQHAAWKQVRKLARPCATALSEIPKVYQLFLGSTAPSSGSTVGTSPSYSDRPRLFAKIWAIPGVRRHQTGDHEMRAIFPPEALEQVAAVIQAKRWGGSGRRRPRNLVRDAGQAGTSAP